MTQICAFSTSCVHQLLLALATWIKYDSNLCIFNIICITVAVNAWACRCFLQRFTVGGRLAHKKSPLWVRALNPSISAVSPFSKLCFLNAVWTCWESTASFSTGECNFHRERTSSLLLICLMLFQSSRYITAHTSFRKYSKVDFTQPYSCAVLKHTCY